MLLLYLFGWLFVSPMKALAFSQPSSCSFFMTLTVTLMYLPQMAFANPFAISTQSMNLEPRRPPSMEPSLKKQPTSSIDYQAGCRLNAPSKAEWDQGMDKQVALWVSNEYRKFMVSPVEETFVEYLQTRYAPDLTDSALYCQGIGQCSIISCTTINTNISSHDRQMAYYAFESIANIDQTYKIMDEAVKQATQYMRNRPTELVRDFTWVTEVEEETAKEIQAVALAMQAIQSLFLVGMAFAGLGAVLVGTVAMAQLAGVTAFIGNNYIAINGMYHGLKPGNPYSPKKVEDAFVESWNDLSQHSTTRIRDNMLAYMSGDSSQTPQNMTVVDLIKSGNFIDVNHYLRTNLATVTTKWFLSVAINSLWTTQGYTYILDTNPPNGDCSRDNRGPPRNRVCLAERPGHSYWLYTITPMDDGHVASPAGLRKLLENGEKYFGITKEDIVRSSLWVHENRLEKKLKDYGNPFVSWKTKNYNYAGSLPGAFTIPVCRNPSGEAISSVWSSNSKNYPCRCGEINWGQNQAAIGLSESKSFYELSLLYSSDKFENHCDHKNDCITDSKNKWTFNIPKGYPKKADELRYAWKKCESRGHKYRGFPKKDK